MHNNNNTVDCFTYTCYDLVRDRSTGVVTSLGEDVGGPSSWLGQPVAA